MQSLAEYLNLDIFKIGFEKGRKEERLQIEQERLKLVKVMFSKGMSLETISEITDYSPKELKLILS